MTKTTTEIKILSAAKKVFMRKGLEATSMNDIAEEAEISRPSLHYYFRTKENLFQAVFRSAAEEFMPQLGDLVRGNDTVENKIRRFVDTYIDLLATTPLGPHFVMSEIYRDPVGMTELFFSVESQHENVAYAINTIDEFAKQRGLKNFDAQQFCLSLYGQCVFPFLVEPILRVAFFDKNSELFKQFLANLKANIVRNALLSLGIQAE
ncbi:MAG: TetR/AcrR family transcriptional regulator [Opitutae bacterium]|nr:TetR/AcrR family transcriptional regulator [Opitutae bacterium]